MQGSEPVEDVAYSWPMPDSATFLETVIMLVPFQYSTIHTVYSIRSSPTYGSVCIVHTCPLYPPAVGVEKERRVKNDNFEVHSKVSWEGSTGY